MSYHNWQIKVCFWKYTHRAFQWYQKVPKSHYHLGYKWPQTIFPFSLAHPVCPHLMQSCLDLISCPFVAWHLLLLFRIGRSVAKCISSSKVRPHFYWSLECKKKIKGVSDSKSIHRLRIRHHHMGGGGTRVRKFIFKLTMACNDVFGGNLHLKSSVELARTRW